MTPEQAARFRPRLDRFLSWFFNVLPYAQLEVQPLPIPAAMGAGSDKRAKRRQPRREVAWSKAFRES